MTSRIFILDDDPRFRKLVASLLKSRGFEIIQAHTGAEGMRLIDIPGIELAIVDYRLPDTCGINWIQWLRDRGSNVPVIFLSGFRCDSKMLSRLRNISRVSLILQKPIQPASFADLIEDLVKENSRQLIQWLNVSAAVQSPSAEHCRTRNIEMSTLESTEECWVRESHAAHTEAVNAVSIEVSTDSDSRVFYLPSRSADVRVASAVNAETSALQNTFQADDVTHILDNLRGLYRQELPTLGLVLRKSISGTLTITSP